MDGFDLQEAGEQWQQRARLRALARLRASMLLQREMEERRRMEEDQRREEERRGMEKWRRKVEERENWLLRDNRCKKEWRREKRARELAFRRLAPREEELELQPLTEDMEADIMDVASIESGVVNEDTEELSSLEREAEELQQVLAGEELWREPEQEEQEERQELESSTPAPAARRVDRERWKVDLEWIFVIVNFVLELPSAVFDQFSSVRKPQFALLSMLMSFAALFICIIELVYKCRKEKVTWKWRVTLPWLYPLRSHKPFGSFKDIIGLVCAICQCVVTTINFNFCLRQTDNPIKISVWPIIFAFGLLCSKFLGDRERVSTNLLPLNPLGISA